MDEFIFILNKVMMFVLLAIPGYLLVKTKCLQSSDSKGITTLLLYAGLPCMIKINTMTMPSTAIASTLADKFKMDSENAVLYSLGSALFAVITIPILYLLLNLII